MRKPRDYDAELKALDTRARQLKTRKVAQLGELVMATGADTLTSEELAGALLAIAATTNATRKEAWRKRGATFFRGRRDSTGTRSGNEPGSTPPNSSSAPPADGTSGAA